MKQIDICIATYRRPQLLQKLLQSLVDQVTDGQFTIRVVVIDNDARGSAEEIAKSFSAEKLRLQYAVEPRQNIALARNRGASLAAGDYIATIDDDEYADPHWLLNLYKTLLACRADVVMGPVTRIFPPETPEYIRRLPLFNFPDPPTASDDNFVHSTRSCLFRRSIIRDMPMPFDPDFGLSGGEDTVFFEVLKRQGRKIVWCREAKAFEVITASKATFRGVLKHIFRNGHTTYLMLSKKLPGADHPSMEEMQRRCWQLLLKKAAGAVLLIAKPFRRPFRSTAMHYLGNIAYASGFLLSRSGLRYEVYKTKGP